MSKHGPCYMNLNSCGPVVAWLTTNPAANIVRLCQGCLDWWFDNADDGNSRAALDWGWIHPPLPPSPRDITAWARDPRNHRDVATVLRLESRINPGWLRAFIARENRANRMVRA